MSREDEDARGEEIRSRFEHEEMERADEASRASLEEFERRAIEAIREAIR